MWHRNVGLSSKMIDKMLMMLLPWFTSVLCTSAKDILDNDKSHLSYNAPLPHSVRVNIYNGTAHFFAFSLIIEGTTENVLQFMMPFQSIYNRNFGFIEQKMYFWTLQRVSSKKNSINWHHFCHEKNICWPFESCPLYAYVSTTKRCAVPLI